MLFGLQPEFEVILIVYPDGKRNTSGQKLPDEYLRTMEFLKGFKPIHSPKLLTPKVYQITSDNPW